jgi:hypothetical protein
MKNPIIIGVAIGCMGISLAYAVKAIDGQRVARVVTLEQQKIVTELVQCTDYGYCAVLSIDMDGNPKYGFDWSAMCPGVQMAETQRSHIEVFRRNGKTDRYWRKQTLKRIGDCDT